MSIESILSRMISDPKFADAVFDNASKALAEYGLSTEELTKFQNLSRATFSTMTPEERRSFAIFVHERSVGGGDPETRNHNETALTL